MRGTYVRANVLFVPFELSDPPRVVAGEEIHALSLRGMGRHVCVPDNRDNTAGVSTIRRYPASDGE